MGAIKVCPQPVKSLRPVEGPRASHDSTTQPANPQVIRLPRRTHPRLPGPHRGAQPDTQRLHHVPADSALDQARRAEQEIQRGNYRGPLHGIPIGLKDILDTAGIRTTAASAQYKDRIPTEDAEVVRRLRAAGAIILGKQNLHEFAYGGSSMISFFGEVHNPWDMSRITGGSSGGSAASVAAGLGFAAIGTDTAGSIRLPAAYCGVVGLKPTYGRVSARGVVPLSWSYDHVGPIVNSVYDAALMLQVLAGYDAGDPASMDAPVPDFVAAVDQLIGQPISHAAPKLRIGVPRHLSSTISIPRSLPPSKKQSRFFANSVLRFARSNSKSPPPTASWRVPKPMLITSIRGPLAGALPALDTGAHPIRSQNLRIRCSPCQPRPAGGPSRNPKNI